MVYGVQFTISIPPSEYRATAIASTSNSTAQLVQHDVCMYMSDTTIVYYYTITLLLTITITITMITKLEWKKKVTYPSGA